MCPQKKYCACVGVHRSKNKFHFIRHTKAKLASTTRRPHHLRRIYGIFSKELNNGNLKLKVKSHTKYSSCRILAKMSKNWCWNYFIIDDRKKKVAQQFVMGKGNWSERMYGRWSKVSLKTQIKIICCDWHIYI